MQEFFRDPDWTHLKVCPVASINLPPSKVALLAVQLPPVFQPVPRSHLATHLGCLMSYALAHWQVLELE